VGENRTIVVGAGPAGLMAAGQAAAAGAETVLLEKMDRPGRKLRLTGKGRCNLTNVAEIKTFIEHIHPDGRFLHSAFSRFFTHDLLAFLESLGIETRIERGGRVFPVNDDAQDIVDALVRWVLAQGVTLHVHSKVNHLLLDDDRIVGVDVASAPAGRGKEGAGGAVPSASYPAETVILATGGASYPGTGSTGDGYRLAASVGHTIVPIRPALVPLETAGDCATRLLGLSLRNVRASVFIDDQKKSEAFGEMLFTHFGLSGPIILTLSRGIVDALQEKRTVSLSIDLKPALDEGKLDERLLRELDAHGNQRYRTLLKSLLPRKLIPVCIDQTKIAFDKPGHQITLKERARLRAWLKEFRFEITGHRSFDQAIITAGGVDTREIDPRSMASRLVHGLYFAGEIMDFDGDTGGYNLQAAFSTGWLAGRSAGVADSRKKSHHG
jgi:predicted Rossmann fold flavoprotein